MASHRMPGKISMGGICLKDLFCFGKHFHRVDTSPLFPVEAEWAAVGRGNDMSPVLRCIGTGLVAGLHGCTVDGQEQCLVITLCSRRIHAVILHASVHIADKGTFVDGRSIFLLQGYLRAVNLFAGFVLQDNSCLRLPFL